MEDLEIAKRELKEKDLSLVIVKSKKIIFTTKEYGVLGLIKAIDKYGKELHGVSVADRIIGKAAAMLCCYGGFKEVYADVISKSGFDTLKNRKIRFEYTELVPNILNRKRDDACPFEKLVAGLDSEKECYEKIKECPSQKLFQSKENISTT